MYIQYLFVVILIIYSPTQPILMSDENYMKQIIEKASFLYKFQIFIIFVKFHAKHKLFAFNQGC